MITVLDELASMSMLIGLMASLVYFAGMQIERLILSKVNSTLKKEVQWIPRTNFQLILGYAAMLSAFGFLVAFPVAERHDLSWRYALLIVSAWFFFQGRTRFLRVQIQRGFDETHTKNKPPA